MAQKRRGGSEAWLCALMLDQPAATPPLTLVPHEIASAIFRCVPPAGTYQNLLDKAASIGSGAFSIIAPFPGSRTASASPVPPPT